MFDLTAFVDRIVVGFDGAIPPRLRNVVGMVFAGAFLKFLDAPRERRVRNTYLYGAGSLEVGGGGGTSTSRRLTYRRSSCGMSSLTRWPCRRSGRQG
jgi:hypothetical protein